MEINVSSGVKMISEEDLKTKLPIKGRENNLVKSGHWDKSSGRFRETLSGRNMGIF